MSNPTNWCRTCGCEREAHPVRNSDTDDVVCEQFLAPLPVQRIYFSHDDAADDGFGWNIVDDDDSTMSVAVRLGTQREAIAWCLDNQFPYKLIDPDTELPSGRVAEIFVDVTPMDDGTFSWLLTTADRTGGISWEMEMPYDLDEQSMRNPDAVYADGIYAAHQLVTGEEVHHPQPVRTPAHENDDNEHEMFTTLITTINGLVSQYVERWGGTPAQREATTLAVLTMVDEDLRILASGWV